MNNLLWIAFLPIISLLLGCGNGAVVSASGGSGGSTTPVAPASITLTNFGNPVPAGSPSFLLYATGSGFTANCVFYWNGQALATGFQTSQLLYVAIPSTLVVAPGSVTIFVKDTVSGAQSATLAYPILSSAAATAGVVQLVSAAMDSSPANGDTLTSPAVSGTGRYVAFQSNATNLVAIPVNPSYDNIFLRDTCFGATGACTPATQLISVSADGTTGGNFFSRDISISQDGRYVAFDSGATNLLSPSPAFCTNTGNCVYLRDTCIGAAPPCTPQTTLVSVLPGEIGAGGALPAISATGRYVAFDSNGGTAPVSEAYRRDTCAGNASTCAPSTLDASINANGQIGNEDSRPQGISADGRLIGFVSYATNLLDASQPAVQSTAKMFVQDTCLGSTSPCTPGLSRVDVPNGGGAANNQLDYEAVPTFSSNGRYIAYSSDATNLTSQNVNGLGNVYVRDTCLGAAAGCTPQNLLASLGNDGSIANAGSHQQSISGDGRFVAFTSISNNLVYNVGYSPGSWQDVYVRDTCAGAPLPCNPSTVRVAVTSTLGLQTPSNTGAYFPAISADGHTAIFVSNSSDLTPAGSAGHAQVFLSRTGF